MHAPPLNSCFFQVGAVGSDTVLSKIMKLVSDAQMRKPEVQAQADVVAAYFVPIVVGRATPHGAPPTPSAHSVLRAPP